MSVSQTVYMLYRGKRAAYILGLQPEWHKLQFTCCRYLNSLTVSKYHNSQFSSAEKVTANRQRFYIKPSVIDKGNLISTLKLVMA